MPAHALTICSGIVRGRPAVRAIPTSTPTSSEPAGLPPPAHRARPSPARWRRRGLTVTVTRDPSRRGELQARDVHNQKASAPPTRPEIDDGAPSHGASRPLSRAGSPATGARDRQDRSVPASMACVMNASGGWRRSSGCDGDVVDGAAHGGRQTSRDRPARRPAGRWRRHRRARAPRRHKASSTPGQLAPGQWLPRVAIAASSSVSSGIVARASAAAGRRGPGQGLIEQSGRIRQRTGRRAGRRGNRSRRADERQAKHRRRTARQSEAQTVARERQRERIERADEMPRRHDRGAAQAARESEPRSTPSPILAARSIAPLALVRFATLGGLL